MKSFGLAVRNGRYLQFLECKEAAGKMGICQEYLSRLENDKCPSTMRVIKSALRNRFISEEEAIEFMQQIFDRKNKSTS